MSWTAFRVFLVRASRSISARSPDGNFFAFVRDVSDSLASSGSALSSRSRLTAATISLAKAGATCDAICSNDHVTLRRTRRHDAAA